MRDEQIVEYLRTRGQATPPLDLVGSVVEAIADAPQQRHSWFAPFIPGVAAVGVAAAVLVAALVIGQSPIGGPDLTQGPSPTTSVAPSIAASSTPNAGSPEALFDPGDTATIDAVDASGTWGSITLTRGDEEGGYPGGSSPNLFLLEVFVGYQAERLPEPAEFGPSNWALRPTDPGAEHFFLVEPMNLAEVAVGEWGGPEPRLGQYPGAVDILSTPTEGWIVFQVPYREANLELELVYLAEGPNEVAIPVRRAEPAPTQPPSPTPPLGEAGYVDKEGLPFAVLDSAEADALFDTPDTCTNPEEGYTLTFPDDWYTNTEINDTPACSWFTPHFFEVTHPIEPPNEIWISIGVVDGVVGYTSTTDVYRNDEVIIGGFEGRRVEFNPKPIGDPDLRIYHYVLDRGSQDRGPTFVASLPTGFIDDYELAKAVLDRIMASLQFQE